MSKRDIETVCTLSAHLAFKAEPGWGFASRCAADALALQRLGRRATRNGDKLADLEIGKTHIVPGRGLFDLEYFGIEKDRIREEASLIVIPYGLRAEVRDEPFSAACLFIIGLPANTKDCGEGFAI